MSWLAELDAVASAFVPGAPVPRPPSREALDGALEALRGALFPELVGGARSPSDLLREAFTVFERELLAEPGLGPEGVGLALSGLARSLPGLRDAARSDVAAAVEGDPAARSELEVLLCYPGFQAIFVHRVAHLLHPRAPLVARALAADAHARTAIDLHPAASIGPRFFVDHGTGVVIGATASIGANVRLYQGVTLGARSFPTDDQGRMIRGAPRHPILEDDVVVFAGATLLGRITIGRGSVIGGGVWLTRSVPPGSRVQQAAVRTGDDFTDGAGI